MEKALVILSFLFGSVLHADPGCPDGQNLPNSLFSENSYYYQMGVKARAALEPFNICYYERVTIAINGVSYPMVAEPGPAQGEHTERGFCHLIGLERSDGWSAGEPRVTKGVWLNPNGTFGGFRKGKMWSLNFHCRPPN
jgi:hypothetical protein